MLGARERTLAPLPDETLDEYRDRIDTALMALWRDTGEEAAFEALYAHSRERVLGWLRWLARGARSEVDSTELLQDTFVNVFRYGAAFRDEGPASFRAWVRTIAGNVLRRSRSRGRPRRRGEVSLTDLEHGSGEPIAPRSAPHLRLSDGEERRALFEAWSLFLLHYHQAFSRLSVRDRRALELVELEGLSYGATCVRLGVSSSNMKMIMLRARRRLQGGMREAMSAGERESWPARSARRLAAVG